MKLFSGKLALFTLSLLAMLCCSCATTEQMVIDTTGAAEVKPIEEKPGEAKPEAVKQALIKYEPTDVVAEMGDFRITRETLEKQVMIELRPYSKQYTNENEPADAKMILERMLAERAMIMEGRKQNYLQQERIKTSIDDFKKEILLNLLVMAYLEGRVTVKPSEIDEKIKAEPKLKPADARMLLRREKTNKLLDQLYRDLCEKFNVRKARDDFPKVSQIYQRLLSNSKSPYSMKFVNLTQVKNELTPEEKNMVLTTYGEDGEITLEYWFYILCDLSPPKRPKNLNTPGGVEQILDSALKVPVFLLEAESRGLDKNPDLLEQVRKQEEKALIGQVIRARVGDMNAPTEQEIRHYYDEHRDQFGVPRTLRIGQIWCRNLRTAQRVKAELDVGSDFNTLRLRYSLERNEIRPFNAYPGNEGIFFEDLWRAEPNEILGPIKGFYGEGIKWRVVKILKKILPQSKEYSAGMNNDIIARIGSAQVMAILAEYRKELFEKYPHKIYEERTRNIDPLDIP